MVENLETNEDLIHIGFIARKLRKKDYHSSAKILLITLKQLYHMKE